LWGGGGEEGVGGGGKRDEHREPPRPPMDRVHARTTDRNDALQLPEDACARRHLNRREHESRSRQPDLARDGGREHPHDRVRVRSADAAENHQRERKRYDRRVSRRESRWPLRRIVVLPLALFVVVSAAPFTLPQPPLAKP